MNRYVLDTSALLALRNDETGADEVERILRAASRGAAEALVSFISFTEIFYIVWQQSDEHEAHRVHLQMKSLPIRRVESAENLGLAAGALKARFPLSLADSWIAATAIQSRAALVHKDPEFESLKDLLALQALPYKRPRL